MLEVARRLIAAALPAKRHAAFGALEQRVRFGLLHAGRRAFTGGRRLVRGLARDFRPRSPRKLVKVLGAIVAVTTALAVPLGCGIIGYVKEADSLAYKAELIAMQAAQHVYASETPWRYDTGQLATLGEARTTARSPIYQRILDTDGNPLAWRGGSLSWPTIEQSVPIYSSGAPVGTVEVSASLRPLLFESLVIGLGSLLLGVAVYLAFAILPLKVVDRSLGELELANHKFRHQNLLLDAAMRGMPYGLCVASADERLVIANDQYGRMYGLAAEDTRPGIPLRQLLDRHIATALFGNEDAYAAVGPWVGKARKASAKSYELNDRRIVLVARQPLADGGWIALHQDITERERLSVRLELQNELLQQREEKLAAQNVRLDAAMENMGHGLAMFDADERIVIANDQFAEMFGLKPDDVRPGTSLGEIVSKRVAAGLYVGSADDYIEAVRARIAVGGVSRIINRLSDGRVLVATINPRADGGWVATHQDVTEHERLTAQLASQNELLQQREAELRAQHLRVDAALENMVQGLAMFDENECIVLANDRFAEMYGLTREQVKAGTTLRHIAELRIANGLYTGLTADNVVNTMRERVARGTVSHLTSKLGDGRTFTVSIRPTGGGGWVTTHQDITERENLNAQLASQNELLQQREEELKSQNMRFNAALTSMSQGLCLFDADQRVVMANDRYAELYGLAPEQVKPGTTLREILEARAANGVYGNMDAQKFVEEGLAGFMQEVSQVVRLADERFISVLRRPLADGGLISTHEDVSERERLNQQLDVALNNMSQGLALFDDDQRLLICNELYADMYGLTPEQVRPGTTARQILQVRADKGCYREANLAQYVDSQAKKFGRIESELHELGDGRIINVAYRRTAKGGHVITHQDVTERQKLLAQLKENNLLLSERTSRLQTIVDNFPGGIAFLDEDLRIVLWNEKARRLLDLPESLFAKGPPAVEDILRFSAQRGDYGSGNEDEQVAVRLELIRSGRPHNFDRPDGTSLETRGVPLDGGGYVTTFVDITERRRSEAKISYMALHDALTGLANRVLLNERLEQSLTRVKRGDIFAVHLLDLDHFKHVNDTLGHPAGDKLLRDVADRLRALVRESDIIARMGGDEFAILQTAIGQPADATALARRVIQSVSEPYDVAGRQVVIGTSVGIAFAPNDGLAPDQLMRNADLALYRAKDDGRGTYRFFEAGMDAEMQERRALECDLRSALPAGEFELHYQPVVNLETNKIAACEALLRWRHPQKGMILPNAFIGLAEETGFIIPLGEWVIRQACATAMQWPAHTRIAVNLSPIQLKNPGLVQVVVGTLAATGLPADRLELEITESALLQDNDATLATLYSLREIGVRIAMDDFGAGYSSLGYLQSFPFDRIKIDRSFIRDIADGLGSRNIVRAVAALGKGLGMETTAEGVETSEQLDSVRSEGCTEVQGFLFSKPRPAHEIQDLLKSMDSDVSLDEGEVSAA
jgi:diguanylate cyclase (GGDEF)-like protein/PAS domain S-box-containing protein